MIRRGRPRTLGYREMMSQQAGLICSVPDVDFGGRFDQVKKEPATPKLNDLLKENPSFVRQLRDDR